MPFRFVCANSPAITNSIKIENPSIEIYGVDYAGKGVKSKFLTWEERLCIALDAALGKKKTNKLPVSQVLFLKSFLIK